MADNNNGYRTEETFYGNVDVKHDLYVGGKLRAPVVEGRNAYLGVFSGASESACQAALLAAFPSPLVGQWAQTLYPDGQGGYTGYLYTCETAGEWTKKQSVDNGLLEPATSERVRQLEDVAVTYTEQTGFDAAAKAQARSNIGAAATNGDTGEDFVTKDLGVSGGLSVEGISLVNNLTVAGQLAAGNGSLVVGSNGNIISDGKSLTGVGSIESVNMTTGVVNFTQSGRAAVYVQQVNGGLRIVDLNNGYVVFLPTTATGRVAMHAEIEELDERMDEFDGKYTLPVAIGAGTFYRYGEPCTDNWCEKFLSSGAVPFILQTNDAERKLNLKQIPENGFYMASGTNQVWQLIAPTGYHITGYKIEAILRNDDGGRVTLTASDGSHTNIIGGGYREFGITGIDKQVETFTSSDTSYIWNDRQFKVISFEVYLQRQSRYATIDDIAAECVRYDATQGLSAAQKTQARENIGAAATNGDIDEDFAAYDVHVYGFMDVDRGIQAADGISTLAELTAANRKFVVNGGTGNVSCKAISAAGDITLSGSITIGASGDYNFRVTAAGFVECVSLNTQGGDIGTEGGNIDLDGGDITRAGYITSFGDITATGKLVTSESLDFSNSGIMEGTTSGMKFYVKVGNAQPPILVTLPAPSSPKTIAFAEDLQALKNILNQKLGHLMTGGEIE